MIDSVQLYASSSRGANVSGERAALLMALPCSSVVQMPPQLPSMMHVLADWEKDGYGLTKDDWSSAGVSAQFATYSGWATSSIQLDRGAQGQHAPSSVHKTETFLRRLLGFSTRVLELSADPSLQVVLNGSLLASFASFALDVRHCKPASVATDVQEAIRLQQYYLALATNADEKADILSLQESTRVLVNQLKALPAHKRSLEELRAAGEYCDLAELWLHIDTFLAEVDYTLHTPANARVVHDALMLLFCFRDHPVTRPTCIRYLLLPGTVEACRQCTVAGCLGNSWSGMTAIIRHFKTASTYGTHAITVQAGSRTEFVLGEYVAWSRPLLIKDASSNALFLTRHGRPFIRDGCFNKYLPRLLLQVSGAKLSWTKVCSTPSVAFLC